MTPVMCPECKSRLWNRERIRRPGGGRPRASTGEGGPEHAQTGQSEQKSQYVPCDTEGMIYENPGKAGTVRPGGSAVRSFPTAPNTSDAGADSGRVIQRNEAFNKDKEAAPLSWAEQQKRWREEQ